MDSLDASLLSLAATQHSMITTSQAASFGLGPAALVHLVRSGALEHPARGLYAVASMREATAEVRHRQLSAGALMLYPDGALSGVSAVLAHGLPVWGVDLRTPYVRRPVDRHRGAIGIHILGGLDEVETGEAHRCEPLDLALVELAITWGVVPGVVSADAALQRGLVTRDALAERLRRVAQWPRSSRARAMVALSDGRSESVGESRCRIMLQANGISLVPQVTMMDRRTGKVIRADFVVEGTKVIIEFDGRMKYADGDATTLWDEKRREDWLRAQGYVVVRLTWADLEHPERAVAKVRRAMASAA